MAGKPDQLAVVLDARELGPARSVGTITRWPGPRPPITFEYDQSWLAARDAFALDPRLLLIAGVQHLGTDTLPPSLADTTPDSWGQMLLERRAGRRLDAWEMLTSVADETRMGALRLGIAPVGPFVSEREPAVPPIAELRRLQSAARTIEDDPEAAIDDPDLALLIAPGSSLGGARPKANIRETDGGLWIAKFPSRADRQDNGAWEFVYAELAAAAGIEVSEHRLLPIAGPGHGRTFLARRFDRQADGGRRLYVSAMTLADRTDGEPASYPDVAQAIADNVSPAHVRADLHQMFRRLVFNLVAGNRDDHLRNHGFLRTREGWRLAPAFDMNPAREARLHTLSVDGLSPGQDIVAAYATRRLYWLSDAEARAIIWEVTDAVARWPGVAASAGIPTTEQRIVGAAFAMLAPATDFIQLG
jgi:serine/threonine-protein kinase HipA